MKGNNLYFLAIVLPEDLQSEIVAIEKHISDQYKTYKSLKIVPHITLKAPFTIASEMHRVVLDWFSQLSISTSHFPVELKNFGSFANSSHPVIYINPLPSASLNRLQSEILVQFGSSFPEVKIMAHELSFKPHVTVAYRDLTPEQFVPAWKEFSEKEFSATFSVGEFHLLQHDGAKWNTIGVCKLG